MQRHSVASFPYILNQDKSAVDKPTFLELLSSHRDNVSCSGQTVRLHERLPSSEKKPLESPRRISVSYKSLVSAPPEIPFRRKSTSSLPNSRTTITKPDKTTQNPPNTPNLLLPTTEENPGSFNKTGSKIAANDKTGSHVEVADKLPKIVLTSTEQTSEKNQKKRKRKDGSKEDSTSSDTKELLDDKNGKAKIQGKVEIGKAPDAPSLEEEEDDVDLKYKLDSKYFQLGIDDTTRSFTYSYFPKIKSKPKKRSDKQNIKKPSGSSIKVNISSPHVH